MFSHQMCPSRFLCALMFLTNLYGKKAADSDLICEPNITNEHLELSDILWSKKPLGEDVCATALGPGFTSEIHMCQPPGDFVCLRNPVLSAFYCRAGRLVVNRRKITVTRGGGPIEDALGRSEFVEIPKYTRGAFGVSCQASSFPMNTFQRYLKDVLGSVRFNMRDDVCQDAIYKQGTTAFITRYGYHNLCLEMHDWYNVFQVIRSRKLDPKSVNIVFLDGHPWSHIDIVWQKLFKSISYVGQLPELSCFEEALFVHPIINSPLMEFEAKFNLRECANSAYVQDFSDFAMRAFHVEPARRKTDNSVIQVTVIRRKDYLGHPRKPTEALRKMSNLDDMLASVQSRPGLHVQAVDMMDFTFAEQLEIVKNTDILVGVHGAGLAHAMWMGPGSVLIELKPESHLERKVFGNFAIVKGLHYIPVGVPGMFPKETEVDVELFKDAMDEAVRKYRAGNA
eukprot:185122_1